MPATATTLAEELRQVVGERAVESAGDGLLIVQPRDTDEVSLCVKLAARHGVRLASQPWPEGGGRSLHVSIARMTEIESIDVKSRVALVQAGARHEALAAAIARRCHEEGVDYELDIATGATHGGEATIVGTLGGGDGCSHVLGVEIVLPDGSVHVTAAGGGRGDGAEASAGLYDRIGPDVTRVLCGGRACRGVVTRLWCRLSPTPSRLRTIHAAFPGVPQACQAVSDMLASGINPIRVQVLDHRTVSTVDQRGPRAAEALMVIDIAGVHPLLDGLLGQITAIALENQATAVFHDDQSRQAGRGRSGLSAAARHVEFSWPLVVVGRSQVGQTMNHIHRLADARGVAATIEYRSADHGLRWRLIGPHDADALQLSQDIAARFGGLPGDAPPTPAQSRLDRVLAALDRTGAAR